MIKLNGIYNFQQIENNVLNVEDCSIYEDKNISVNVVTDAMFDVASQIAKVYNANDTSWVQQIQALFIAVIWDKKNSKFSIFTDTTSSMLNLYYIKKDAKLYYSTSLKWLLKESKCNRKLNNKAAGLFLINGFLPSKETLLENIYKLEANTELRVSGNDIKQVKYKYKIQKEKHSIAEKNILGEIQKNIVSLIDNKLNIPLSNGYDSNLILHTLLENTEIQIDAYTVGGAIGNNETEEVKKNVANIPRVNLHTIIVDKSYFEYLPDIVWRLEGCVYECGIFLQYALARVLHNSNVKSLICGEYADQVLSVYYELSRKRLKYEKKNLIFDPYICGNYMILKKSGVMLNSYGIIGRYPFAYQNIIPMAIALKFENLTSKFFYKKKCNEFFRELNLFENDIKKNGGTTSNQAVVSEDDCIKMEPFLNFKLSQYMTFPCYKSRFSIHNLFCNISWFLFSIKTEGLFKCIDKIINKTKNRKFQKMSNRVLVKLYLYIFIELFITGKYDLFFERENAPVFTKDVLSSLEDN